MKIKNPISDQAVLTELGNRVARLRLDRNLTQAELAFSAGVSLRTIGRMESGKSIQLSGFVRILRELELLNKLEVLFPSEPPSPIEQRKAHGKTRQRASTGTTKSATGAAWSWDDDA